MCKAHSNISSIPSPSHSPTQKIDDNSQKIDELHDMLKPMWEEFTGRSYDGNIASFHATAVKGE